MPIYEYKVGEGHEGCAYCRESFTVEQKIKEEALKACPKCGAPVERLIFPVGISSVKGDSELKNLGFTKLVRRDQGVYENVTRTGKESRYMEADKPETRPDLKRKISD